MRMKLESAFYCGDRVLVGDGEIEGVVERVIFERGMSVPLYGVMWWQDGDVLRREFLGEDLSPAKRC